MMTQGVMTQATNLLGSASTNVTSKGKQSGKGFDLLISNNMMTNQSNSSKPETTTVKKTSYQKTDADSNKSDITDNDVKETDYSQTKAATSTEHNKIVSQTEDAKVGETQVTDNTVEEKTDVEDVTAYEKLMAEIVGMLQSMQEAVMQTMNLSAEEFNQLLEEQGMSISDLLQPEKLQQLLLAKNGQADILSVLTDENLANQMNELLQQVEDIVSEANLGLTKDQIDEIISQGNLNAKNDIPTDLSQLIQDAEIITEQVSNQHEISNAFPNSVIEDEKSSASEGTTDNVAAATLTEGTKESYSSTQEENTKQDQRELSAQDHFQTFVENLVNASNQTKFDLSGNMVKVTELREIATQIIERIKVSITPDQTSMELQLNPENLGKVNFSIQSKNGVLTAQFVVQNEVSKEAIESQMHILREALNEQGIKVEAIEVTVSNYAFDQTNQEDAQNQASSQQNNTKKITLEEAMNMVDSPEEVIGKDNVTDIIGSQINYTA